MVRPTTRSCGASSSSGGRRHAEHDRLVRDLQPALGEERRERRLAGAAHADEHDVGLLEVARLLAVVALHRELDRLDAPEVLVGEREHSARRVDGLRSRKVDELADERADEVERLDLQLVALRVDVLAQLRADDGEDDERALSRRCLENGARRPPSSGTRVCRRMCAPEWGNWSMRGADDLLRRLAGRVAQHVDVARFFQERCSILKREENG